MKVVSIYFNMLAVSEGPGQEEGMSYLDNKI